MQNHRFLFFISIITIAVYFSACVSIPNRYEGLAPGPWRGLLFINQHKELIVTEGRKKDVKRDVDFEEKSNFVAFNFEIGNAPDGKQIMTVINGAERMVFDEISLGRDIRTGDDTFYIKLSPYDACLKGIFEGDKMKGHWIVLDKSNYSMEFEAKYGQSHRYKKTNPAKVDATIFGHYQAKFGVDTEKPYDAIGEFEQTGDKLTGTFRTESGDFRFLEGQVVENELWLSTFDGSHAFLFHATITGDSLDGMFYSGIHYKTQWKAVKVKEGKLKHADSLSTAVSSEPFYFGFETPDGQIIDFRDEKFKNKLKLVQIMGSWCPNCLDEAVFLNEYFHNNPNDKVVVLGLSFERHPEKQKAMQRILDFKTKLKLAYDIALGGKANRDSASKVIPQISQLMAFPTLLFVDHHHKIVKVHTGFDGPATSKYQEYIRDFETNIRKFTEHE
ncbi:MAG: TlpA family protein disulfide reductase [Saprospiraceae bacterium]|nr:TlpA family protein disulfide reductase [Saprospiraceae bacterium]